MNKVIPLQSRDNANLSSVWSFDTGHATWIRGPLLASKDQTDSWLQLIRSFPCEKKRWVSLLLAMPDNEWPIITSEHFYLEGTWVPHIVVPTPLVSPPKREEPRSDLQWKTILKFIQQINCEGWLFYSEWLDDEMDRTMAKFYKDATEEFQVEGTLRDFHHEITSFLLRDYRVNCAKLVMQLGQGSRDSAENRQRDYELETEIVRMHFEILNNLSTQRDVLLKIESSIGKVEALHPELIPLKLTARLLSTLLGPPLGWIQNMMFIALLNHQLDVNVYIHCNSGYDRTNLGFAILLAIEDMLGRSSVEEMIRFVESYPQSTALSSQFKRLVWEYLSDVCVPLTKANPVWNKWAPERSRIDDFLDGSEQIAL